MPRKPKPSVEDVKQLMRPEEDRETLDLRETSVSDKSKTPLALPDERSYTIKEGYVLSVAAAEKSSEIMRQLALGGLAIVWVFKTQTKDVQTVPYELFWPSILLAVSLLFDLLQTIVKSELWRIASMKNERKGLLRFTVTPWLGRTVDFFYWIKMGSVVGAYILLLYFLLHTVFFPLSAPAAVLDSTVN